MTLQQTSLFAFKKISETVSHLEQEVLELFGKHERLTDKDICLILDWTVNRVNGRRNGLYKRDLVRNTGDKKIYEGFPSIIWEITDKGRSRLFKNRTIDYF